MQAGFTPGQAISRAGWGLAVLLAVLAGYLFAVQMELVGQLSASLCTAASLPCLPMIDVVLSVDTLISIAALIGLMLSIGFAALLLVVQHLSERYPQQLYVEFRKRTDPPFARLALFTVASMVLIIAAGLVRPTVQTGWASLSLFLSVLIVAGLVVGGLVGRLDPTTLLEAAGATYVRQLAEVPAQELEREGLLVKIALDGLSALSALARQAVTRHEGDVLRSVFTQVAAVASEYSTHSALTSWSPVLLRLRDDSYSLATQATSLGHYDMVPVAIEGMERLGYLGGLLGTTRRMFADRLAGYMLDDLERVMVMSLGDRRETALMAARSIAHVAATRAENMSSTGAFSSRLFQTWHSLVETESGCEAAAVIVDGMVTVAQVAIMHGLEGDPAWLNLPSAIDNVASVAEHCVRQRHSRSLEVIVRPLVDPETVTLAHLALQAVNKLPRGADANHILASGDRLFYACLEIARTHRQPSGEHGAYCVGSLAALCGYSAIVGALGTREEWTWDHLRDWWRRYLRRALVTHEPDSGYTHFVSLLLLITEKTQDADGRIAGATFDMLNEALSESRKHKFGPTNRQTHQRYGHAWDLCEGWGLAGTTALAGGKAELAGLIAGQLPRDRTSQPGWLADAPDFHIAKTVDRMDLPNVRSLHNEPSHRKAFEDLCASVESSSSWFRQAKEAARKAALNVKQQAIGKPPIP